MLRGGITTCNDMYFYPEATAEAFTASGGRARGSPSSSSRRNTPDADDYLSKGLATFDAWRDDPLIHFTLSPHAPATVADKTLNASPPWPTSSNCPSTSTSTKPPARINDSLRDFGQRPISRLDPSGLLSAPT